MKLTQSLVAIAALGTLTSTLSFAGGDINPVTVFEQEAVVVPVEPVVVPKAPPPPPRAPAPIPVAEPLGLYIAGGLTSIATRAPDTNWANPFKDINGQDRQIGFTGRLGYNFMDYLGAELRGTVGIAKANGSKFKQVGAYLKPNYNLTDELNLYGLVGASKSNLAGISNAQTGLSYGAGLDYDLGNNISVFTDIVNYMDKSNVPEAWGASVGAAYNF